MKYALRQISLSFSIFFISCFVATQLHADVDHYKNMLIGERAATMGGTYVAISDDSTGRLLTKKLVSYQ